MTRNQIEYWRNVETERANRFNEAETRRSNLAREVETNRHNVATERLTDRQLRETQVNNFRNYMLGVTGQNETIRSNKAREKETNRANIASEQERIQQRLSNERIKTREQSISQYGALTGRMQAEEVSRSNRAKETYNLLSLTELQRSNAARESETIRSDVAREAETRRSNMANENISLRSQAERERSNRATEANVVRGQNLQLVGNLLTGWMKKSSNSNGFISNLKTVVSLAR